MAGKKTAKGKPAQAIARPLSAYDAKRDFTKSPEPKPTARKTKSKTLSFCVQKHLASHLHYDFRLEHNGVLLSWAVPKGPSLNPADKRMAVHVEDHPVDYGNFEGVIPSGYGAGIVLLWDRGTWTPDPQTPDIDAALKAGELKFSLEGVKLKGSWVLVRTRRQPDRASKHGPEQWLLIKHRDSWSGEIDVAAEAPLSVKSFGDLPTILAAHGMVDEWRTKPPVKGGATGKLLQAVIALATSHTAVSANPPSRKSKQDEWNTNPGGKHDPAASATGKQSRIAPARSRSLPASALKLGSNKPKLTNQTKVLFPKTGFTKGDLVAYYTRVAPQILPHLVGRAVSLHRFPDGVEGKSFFEKHCNKYRPDWVKTVRVHTGDGTGAPIDFCEIADLASLQWAANLGAIELHVPLALAVKPDTPTAMIFDLDPGEPASFKDCVAIGLRLKALLDELGLQSVPKTSGGKGLHVLIPLNTPDVTFGQTKAFARAIALTMERDDPKRVIASMAKVARKGKVFIDWSQNDRNKTNACVFSVRAREQPSVSWPMSWDALAGKTLRLPVTATIDGVDRETSGLLKILGRKQRLPK